MNDPSVRDPSGDPAQAVLAAVRALDAAFNARDLQGVLEHYEPEAALVVQPGVVVSGVEALRSVFPVLMGLGSAVRVTDGTVIASGDLALLVARWTIRRATAGGDIDSTEVATSVLRRGTDGRWRLRIDNAFGPRVLPDPPAEGGW